MSNTSMINKLDNIYVLVWQDVLSDEACWLHIKSKEYPSSTLQQQVLQEHYRQEHDRELDDDDIVYMYCGSVFIDHTVEELVK